jgi:hypothetical protein
MSAESPEPPYDNGYDRCLRAEHAPTELEFLGNLRHDVVSSAEELLYRHDQQPSLAQKVGRLPLKYLGAVLGVHNLPTPQQLSSVPTVRP